MMAPRLKQAFERARQRGDRLGSPSISPAVLLAAVLGVDDALAAALVERLGVDLGRLRALLDPP